MIRIGAMLNAAILIGLNVVIFAGCRFEPMYKRYSKLCSKSPLFFKNVKTQRFSKHAIKYKLLLLVVNIFGGWMFIKDVKTEKWALACSVMFGKMTKFCQLEWQLLYKVKMESYTLFFRFQTRRSPCVA